MTYRRKDGNMYTTQGAKPTSEKQRDLEEKNMISYGMALARAKAAKSNWNEEEYITKAVITWADADYENVLEVENDGFSDEEFEAWIEQNAEELAKKAAAEQGTTFEELVGIDYETDTYDDDEAFYDAYLDACDAEGDYYREMGW